MPAQPEPNAVDTAVLPAVEGPQLVRPYVPAPAFEHETLQAVAGDAAATQLLPPVPDTPPIPAPPAAPPVIESQAMTMTMPPVPPAPPAAAAKAPAEQEPELGLFDFHGATEHRQGGRADRRTQQQAEDSRRRTLIIGAGVGIAAIGAGLALLVAPSDSGSGNGNGKTDQALPTATGSLWAPSPADPSPSTGPSSAAATTTTSAAPKPATSHPVSKAPATSAKPATTTPAPAPPPAPSPTVRTLKPGDQGQDVADMQKLLVTAYCDHIKQRITGVFDQQTEQNIVRYQQINNISGEDGVYGPQTRAMLTNDAANPNC